MPDIALEQPGSASGDYHIRAAVRGQACQVDLVGKCRYVCCEICNFFWKAFQWPDPFVHCESHLVRILHMVYVCHLLKQF